jgi:hypothetical protein
MRNEMIKYKPGQDPENPSSVCCAQFKVEKKDQRGRFQVFHGTVKAKEKTKWNFNVK